MPTQCIFCEIISKKIPSKIVIDTGEILAFHDISPVAPVHILIVPKNHVANINQLSEGHKNVVADIIMLAQKIAKEQGIDRSGYRLVVNTERDAGQSVDHLHFHLIGGRSMAWPPG